MGAFLKFLPQNFSLPLEGNADNHLNNMKFTPEGKETLGLKEWRLKEWFQMKLTTTYMIKG